MKTDNTKFIDTSLEGLITLLNNDFSHPKELYEKNNFVLELEETSKIIRRGNYSDSVQSEKTKLIISKIEVYLEDFDDPFAADILSMFYYLLACFNLNTPSIALDYYSNALEKQVLAFVIKPSLDRMYEISSYQFFLGEHYAEMKDLKNALVHYKKADEILRYLTSCGYKKSTLVDDHWVVKEKISDLQY